VTTSALSEIASFNAVCRAERIGLTASLEADQLVVRMPSGAFEYRAEYELPLTAETVRNHLRFILAPHKGVSNV
jgi:hypothetical protein